jgi:hypothetical protein
MEVVNCVQNDLFSPGNSLHIKMFSISNVKIGILFVVQPYLSSESLLNRTSRLFQWLIACYRVYDRLHIFSSFLE